MIQNKAVNENVNLTKAITQMDCLKHSIVKELFINTADSSYTIARWTYLNRMYLDFYWNSVHALEKYFKAALLLNGKSSIQDDEGNYFSHDIRKLLTAVEHLHPFGSGSPIIRPDKCSIHWTDETLGEFISRLYDMGEPNNRYNMYGFFQRPEDLVKLDAVVFKARNIAQYLDGYAFLGRYETNGGENLSSRDLLNRCPNHKFNFNGSRLAELSSPKRITTIKNAVLDQNLYFAPEEYEHPSFAVGLASANSIFYMRIGIYLENENYEGRIEDLELIDWILGNIQLPKELKGELNQAKLKFSKRLSQKY